MPENKAKDQNIEETCTRHDVKKQLYDLSDDIRRIADDFADGKPVDSSAVALINLKLSTLGKVVTERWFPKQLQTFPTRQKFSDLSEKSLIDWPDKVRKDLEEKGIAPTANAVIKQLHARIDSGNVN